MIRKKWWNWRRPPSSISVSYTHLVASRYDLMNDLMSGGIHRLWKAYLIDRLYPRPGQTLLDIAGGTGDIAARFLDRAGADAQAIVCDINESMVATGRDRAIDRGRIDGIDWVVGDAERLPLAAMSVDSCTCLLYTSRCV